MKKNPIIFIAMLVALAFTSCQMNTDDSVVIPPTPTTEATEYTVSVTQPDFGGTVSVDKAKAKASETVTITTTANDGFELETISVKKGEATVTVTDKKFTMPSGNVTVNAAFAASSYTVKWDNGIFENKFSLAKVKAYITQIGLVETTHYSIDKKNGVLTFTSAGYAKVAAYLKTNGEPTVTETPTTDGGDSTQWNLVASVIKHENGVGKNDGAFHGTITLNKAKANTGDTVTITVTPDADFELGAGTLKVEFYGISKTVEPTKVNETTYTFTLPDNAGKTTVSARFDPVDGYTVKIFENALSKVLLHCGYDNNKELYSKNYKVGKTAYVYVSSNVENVGGLKVKINGKDYVFADIKNYPTEGKVPNVFYKMEFPMPVKDVFAEVTVNN